MTDGRFIGLGDVGLLAVLCCAAPFVLVAVGSFGISAWLAATGYVVVPIVLAVIGVAGFYFYRRSRSASSADNGGCSINDKTTKVN
ncbi:hypothetical protein [Agrobacterium sp. P15N1-A]|uniref:hypothetical protein n=1 Tax=Agrobacterium sp. P15N1-A TaxID=3342820 RepID=UPI0037D59DA3